MQTDTTTAIETNWRLASSTLSLYAEKLIIRIILRHDGLKKNFGKHSWDNDVALPLGLPEEIRDEPDTRQIIRTLLEARWQEIRHKEDDETSFLSRPKKILTLLLHVSVLMKLKLPYFAWQSIYVAKKHCVRYSIDIICVILIVAIILLLIFLIFHQIMFFAL
jgi:hypothetical protein